MNGKKSPNVSESNADFLRTAVDAYSRPLHRHLLRLLRNPADAEEVCQETFTELWRTRSADPIRNLQAYVYRIAWRVFARRKLREQQDRVSFDSDVAEKGLEARASLPNDDVADEVALESDLENAAGRLSPMQQSVLLLSLYGRKSDAEIAAELDLSEHTVRKYLKTAKAQLRRSCGAGKDQPG